MGGDITGPLMGVAVGHLYYFLVDVLPISHGLVSKFIIQLFHFFIHTDICYILLFFDPPPKKKV